MSGSPFCFSDRRAHFAALLAVFIASVALRLFLFDGYIGLDDAEYARIAYQIANGSFSLAAYGGPPVFPLRVGLVLPTALAFRMFGLSEWSMVLYPLILSVLALALVYVCAMAFFSHRAGLVAVALLGIVPIELWGGATKLLPDMPAAFYAALGVVVIALVDLGSSKRGAVLFWSGCLAGVSFGISWLCKESISFLAPFCIAFMLITFKQRGRSVLLLWAGVAAGSLGILLGEMVVYRSVTGDALFRFHEIERNYRQLENGFFTEGSDFGWQKGESHAWAIAKRLFIAGPAMLLLNYEFLFLPLIGLIAACRGWYLKDKSFLVPSLWLVTLVVMFNFSSSSLSSYMPLALFERYFFLIVFPSIVLTSGLISTLVLEGGGAPGDEAQKEKRFWGLLVTIALVLMGGYHLQSSLRASSSNWVAEVRSLSTTIRPSTRLYTDTLSVRGLEFFSHYPDKTAWTDFANVASAAEIPPGSLVLVNNAYIGWLNRNAGMWLSPRSGYRKHRFYENPPPSWKMRWETPNARLYRVE